MLECPLLGAGKPPGDGKRPIGLVKPVLSLTSGQICEIGLPKAQCASESHNLDCSLR